MKTRFFSWTLLFFLVAPVASLAQLGRIQGTVTDQKGTPLKNVQILIEGMDVKRKYKVKTNKQGKYMHVGIIYQGRYRIIVSKEGYLRQYMTRARASMDIFDKEKGLYDFELVEGDHNTKFDFEITLEERAQMNKRKREEEKAAALEEKLSELYDLGQALLGNMQYADAIGVFLSAIKLDKAQPAVWTALALAYQKVERLQDALVAFKNASALAPNSALYQNMGNIYRDLKEPEKAQEMYDKSLELSAGSPPSVTE